MSIYARDIRVSMLLTLLLVNMIILSCFFFLFLVIFSNFLTIPVVREKINVKLAFAIPTGAPIILANEIIDTPPLVALTTIKLGQYNQKQLHIYLVFHSMISFD